MAKIFERGHVQGPNDQQQEPTVANPSAHQKYERCDQPGEAGRADRNSRKKGAFDDLHVNDEGDFEN